MSFSILIVCRANVCRSPLAAALLSRALDDPALSDVVVISAGTDALPGEPACGAAIEWSGIASTHRAVEITAGLLEGADLVLAADRMNRSDSAVLVPSCRPRLFTLEQGAVLARALDPVGCELSGVAERLRWLVEEWDAERALLGGRDEAADDIVDLHGPEPHEEAFEAVDAAVRAISQRIQGFALREPI